MYPIAIMQGRLSPPFEVRLQAFPADSWAAEFTRARAAGLAHLEWIYEQPHRADNPILTAAGVATLNELQRSTSVTLRSLCADYYMTELLVPPGDVPNAAAVADLYALLARLPQLGIRYVVLPFVDASSLTGRPAAQAALVPLLRAAADAGRGVELHLETDLPPPEFVALLRAINHPLVRANYDSGNSASLGYEPGVELPLLAPWLGSVHIKDRLRRGGTVPLGTGAADFPACFQQLQRLGYRRHYTLQVARGAVGDEVAWAAANRQFVERGLAAASGT